MRKRRVFWGENNPTHVYSSGDSDRNRSDFCWRGLVRLSIYGPPEEKPEPVRSLEVVNPIKARLDDKQP